MDQARPLNSRHCAYRAAPLTTKATLRSPQIEQRRKPAQSGTDIVEPCCATWIGFALKDTSGDALREGIFGTHCLALEEQKTMIIERLKAGVITVGHGRGFVVEGAGERLVITAAHCLPSLPPAVPSFGQARIYGPLLARRGEEPRAWAVCRFVDPIADIAVLGSPDNPRADDYKALMGTATALSFGDHVRHPVNFWGPARLLSLDGRWFSCTIRHFGGPLWITHAAERVRGGMSGSPIVAVSGTAIGVVCTTTSPREGGPNARLNLPGWLLH